MKIFKSTSRNLLLKNLNGHNSKSMLSIDTVLVSCMSCCICMNAYVAYVVLHISNAYVKIREDIFNNF